MNEFTATLSVVAITHLLSGVFYAWQIYLAPSPHGYTGISVAVGTLIVLSGSISGYLVLALFDATTTPNVLVMLLAALLIAGVPMAAGQGLKKYREDLRNKQLLDDDNG